MKRTVVYLAPELKQGLERAARMSGLSEAELIRAGVQRVVAEHAERRPRIPLFSSGDPTLAERVGDCLAGFGAC